MMYTFVNYCELPIGRFMESLMKIQDVIERVSVRQAIVECGNPQTRRKMLPTYPDHTVRTANKPLHRTAIPLCSIAAAELYRYTIEMKQVLTKYLMCFKF